MNEKETLKKVIDENLMKKEAIRQRVLYSCQNQSIKENKKSKFLNINKKLILIPASLCVLFTIAVNTNSVFAQAMLEIPIIKQFAKVVTFSEYTSNNDSNIIHVKVPNIEETGNTKVENRINTLLNERIDKLAEEAKADAANFMKNYTGGKIDKIKIDFDYEVKSSNKDILSFIVKKKVENPTLKYEGSSDVTFYNYNIDIKTGEEITLESMLGQDYKNIINKQVKGQIEERCKTDEILASYYEKFYKSKNNIDFIYEGQPFYINENGNVVMVFYEYFVAPFSYGIQEFEIQE
ncbi:DUF3298 and DUF4163 domain-containing protein [Romboutsia lituseburensis]|uniref:DUF3298 and DUF4163 domain-containing protein n=1 Tax=Romboutsia lituseburensis TaxID=1537 RepID=UPI00215AFF40|nr:DUF3298 and DUF4163 domain-containing protein [Romboutsia lituseburensis]MCR8745382.1 DUF3298 and DUF4163 domain-containing protein [Romboutsia lituseburensis]